MTSRRAFTLATLCLCLTTAAQAADYPTRPVKMVVAFGPGTTTDLIARMISERLSANLGQPVIIENRAGAGGSIGTDLVAKAAADGYTLTLGTVGTHAINKTLYRKLPYDPVKDFDPIALVGYTPTLLVTRADAPFGSVRQLVDYARANPDKVTFASAGSGTSGHLAGALLGTQSNTNLLHVPYKEGAQAVTAVMSGETHFMFYHPTAVMPQVKAGRLKALASSAATRGAQLSDIPTVAESGYKDFDLTAWFIIAAPRGIPADVKTRLVNAASQALKDPAVARKLLEQGVEGSTVPQDKLDEFLKTETTKWAQVIKAANAIID